MNYFVQRFLNVFTMNYIEIYMFINFNFVVKEFIQLNDRENWKKQSGVNSKSADQNYRQNSVIKDICCVMTRHQRQLIRIFLICIFFVAGQRMRSTSNVNKMIVRLLLHLISITISF